MTEKSEQIPRLLAGLDVGSTTVKLVVLDAQTQEVLHARYVRHHAHLRVTALELVREAAERFGVELVAMGVCGSGGKPIAQLAQTAFVQEVVANAVAVRTLYPQARTAIELGGQDAKVIFFRREEHTGKLVANDMRMNGSCAGGTGAFIDEIAKVLGVETEEFEGLAAQGGTVYDVSGRCGVFAKTDIQPLLAQGAPHADIALSTFHAIAKQVIGGLAQGMELSAPIVFEGGPLTYNPTLVRVFAERLGLSDGEVIRPENADTIVALGAALAIEELSGAQRGRVTTLSAITKALEGVGERAGTTALSAGEEPDATTALAMGEGWDAATTLATGKPFFANAAQRQAFEQRHRSSLGPLATDLKGPAVLPVYIGIDSGSTTSKVVAISQDGSVVDSFYAPNAGDSVRVVQRGLIAMRERFLARGITPQVLGACTTGYGEMMCALAFSADFHIVETVAHARGCVEFNPDASFLLDIGGQDMKAMWLDEGVVTDVVLNEACSAGCGSFLEHSATNLSIPVDRIADEAFLSEHPAVLGSRCTVFMTSTVITAQRDGASARDIVAGLCRSVVENVFTKVVRVANVADLGERIVVQGGTFRNLAVVRALEEYLGREVVRAPYPGEMGALGAALYAKDHSVSGRASTFLPASEIEQLDFRQLPGVSCGKCANACNLTITEFSTGARWVTGNRCERGLADNADNVDNAGKRSGKRRAAPCATDGDNALAVEDFAPTDVFALRERMLFETYPCKQCSPAYDEVIGIPRVLEFWDSMPFWTTFFRALGFDVRVSPKSTQTLFESGLPYVASDTVCLPAKLAHGHVKALADAGVTRIFMPYIMHMPTEGAGRSNPYVCPIIMGYPMVVRNFESPETRFGVAFDTPVFHWYKPKDRVRQVCAWAVRALGVSSSQARRAFEQGESALLAFRKRLVDATQAAVRVACDHSGAVAVLAGRPYQNDPFVSHRVSRMLVEQGMSVVPVDGLPGLSDVKLENLRPELTNNFHTRMLASAMVAARDPHMEYVQLVSFGCGHDAILTDEITRILNQNGKSPLVLKLDESDVSGTLGIRVRSFAETSRARRAAHGLRPYRLEDPYTVKFTKDQKPLRTLLIPNINAEVSMLFRGLFRKAGFKVQMVPVGGLEQIALGKRYAHNDICFPCQMVIGELLSALQQGGYDQDEVAVGMVKFQCDCRMANYASLLRKALDAAGFSRVPIVTTDVADPQGMHPGVSVLTPNTITDAIWGFVMLDMLQDMKRSTRPYEVNPGQTNTVFLRSVEGLSAAAERGVRAMKDAFRIAVDAIAGIPCEKRGSKPRVLVTGELLVTYHPGSNFHIEEYLERCGMETVFPRITDQLRKDFLAAVAQFGDFRVNFDPGSAAAKALFDRAQRELEPIACRNPHYERHPRPAELYEEVAAFMPKTLSCGEGWLMAAEIVHYAKQGVRSFVILQPFGCLPNHICGRGVTKRIKDDFPDGQILPLDLDPDTSYANVESRLQMLVMNAFRAGDVSG